jgi:hypothetical protein
VVKIKVEVAIEQVVMLVMENLQIIGKDMATRNVKKCLLAPISYKHTKHTTMKELVDPRAQMIFVKLRWEKIVENL